MPTARNNGDSDKKALLRDLVVECLGRLEDGDGLALEALCARHPECATELRSRLASLRAFGMMSAEPDTGTAGPVDRDRDIPDRLGEFRLVRRIGGGGMGVVYRASS